MTDAYEPLQFLRSFFEEDFFLTSFASAKRVGELQALSGVVSFQGSDLILLYQSLS